MTTTSISTFYCLNLKPTLSNVSPDATTIHLCRTKNLKQGPYSSILQQTVYLLTTFLICIHHYYTQSYHSTGEQVTLMGDWYRFVTEYAIILMQAGGIIHCSLSFFTH